MKQTLQLKLTQQLAMTPQLQQAIRLLQLSTLDLQQELEIALENNPLLEKVENYDDHIVTTPETSEVLDSADALKQELPEELPLDASWDEIYTAGTPSGTQSDYNWDELPTYQGETTQTLQDYLLWQADLTHFSETDYAIATSIIDAIDDSGYLTASLDEIQESLGNEEIELAEIEVVLKRMQHFDPIGVASRDLRECLLVQLTQLEQDTPHLNEARLIVSEHLSLLAQRDFKTLSKTLHLGEEELKQAIKLIHSLDPRPGESINSKELEHIIPDVLVVKVADKWVVRFNDESIPKVRINQHYASFEDHGSESDNQFIKTHLQEARWLLKSIESRNETLLKASSAIVARQQDFFEQGPEGMKPMTLSDIAKEIDMHESTVSRITTHKYLHCPRGIFELKYFFSSGINTHEGGEASSVAIRALIKKLIEQESSKKPLSDSKIASLLEEQGLVVARRTVAKYRELLGIPPSSQRKELI